MSVAVCQNEHIKVELTYKALDPIAHLDYVKTRDSGAVIYFAGITREDTVADSKVTYLEYEAHEKMAVKTLVRLAEEAKKQFTNGDSKYINKISVSHRLGKVPVLEDSIIISVSAGHRQEGWKCIEWLLEEIKKTAEIWKNEFYNDQKSQWKENENACTGST